MSDTKTAEEMASTRPANPFADPEYRKLAEEREAEYRIGTLLDRELGIAEPEVGRETYAKAAAYLRDRGIHPDAATQEQLGEALRRVA